jgi:hypothetical protein
MGAVQEALDKLLLEVVQQAGTLAMEAMVVDLMDTLQMLKVALEAVAVAVEVQAIMTMVARMPISTLLLVVVAWVCWVKGQTDQREQKL